jgi:hypothetical protein
MKLKVFLSSRNMDEIYVNGKSAGPLQDMRMYLKEELEKSTLFEKTFLEIVINEQFGSDMSKEKYQYCLDEVKNSDLTIALYNGTAGWAPQGFPQGICHAELATSLSLSSKKTALIDMSEFFQIKERDKAEKERNELFKSYVDNSGLVLNPLKISRGNATAEGFRKALLDSIRNIIFKHLSERIKLSNRYFDLSSNTPQALDWKKLKYEERAARLREALSHVMITSPNFSDFLYEVHAIPDNMSVSDASAFAGRPFLKDQEAIRKLKTKNGHGPIHFIGVYGQATETQVKKLIGFPDISTMREGFGIYVWEQNTQIQMVFFIGCKTPEAVRSNFILFDSWCASSEELHNIKLRARARFRILQAINEANDALESSAP